MEFGDLVRVQVLRVEVAKIEELMESTDVRDENKTFKPNRE
jgi:hypothetical protein